MCPPELCLSFRQGRTGSPTLDRHALSCCVMLLAFGICFERSQMNGWNKDLWSSELHSQFSEMKMNAVLPWNSDVLTPGVSNPHPKVREGLVPLGSHSVMTPLHQPHRSKTLLSFGLPLPERPCGHGRGTHCHHVITLHIRLVVIFTFVIELAEEVESHHSIEVDNHSQESNSQNQLG